MQAKKLALLTLITGIIYNADFFFVERQWPSVKPYRNYVAVKE